MVFLSREGKLHPRVRNEKQAWKKRFSGNGGFRRKENRHGNVLHHVTAVTIDGRQGKKYLSQRKGFNTMNNTVAFIGLGAAACITAPAFAQDTHTSLTKQSVACMQEITAAMNKVTDEPGAAAAVETVKKVHEKLVDLGKRQLELPGATSQEQAQIAAQMVEIQKVSGELVKSLARLKKENLLTPDLQKALIDLQSVQTELAQASKDKAARAEPFPKDAEGNTHETLLEKPWKK